MTRKLGAGFVVLVVVVASLLGACAGAGAATTHARATPVATMAKATSCKLANGGRGLGPTYVEKVTVSHTTCATAKKVIKGYNTCRVRHGGINKGRCNSKVDGFTCKQGKRQGSPIEWAAEVTATKGRARITFIYVEAT